ncbi:MAG: NAD(P)-binding protein [Acidimicrobiales bacterium]
MSVRYPLLYSPIRLGSVSLKNRVVFAAHLTNFAHLGQPSEAHLRYYERRAKGGAGLIITEELSVAPNDWPYEKMIHGYRREVIPSFRKITDAVHRHGASIFAQINHNGAQGTSRYSGLPLWAPSAIRDPLFQELPIAITPDQINDLYDAYALTARNAIEGGFDGVELQCSHSSIVRQFLSPLTNHRDDNYGGDQEGRMRLPLELVARVRKAIGDEAVLGVRLCGDELIDGGIVIDEAIEVAKALEATGQLSYLNTSIGVATASLYVIEASMGITPEYLRYIPSGIRSAVTLPVVGSGRIKDPEQAEHALRRGHMDLVGMVRAQIADPDLAHKAALDAPERIRLCLSCNQECVGQMGLNRWLGCIENVDAGREFLSHQLPHTLPVRFAPRNMPRRSTKLRRIAVIGGGPAGLKAACALAETGHRVTLFEADQELGGTVRLAALIASRAEFGDLVRNLVRELDQYPVEVQLGHMVVATDLLDGAFDTAVCATGSVARWPYWVSGAPDRAPMVHDLHDLIATRPRLGRAIVIVDEIGDHRAASVASWLSRSGHLVSVVTPQLNVAAYLGVTLDYETWNLEANALGIVQLPERIPTALIEGALLTMNHLTGATDELPCDDVIFVGHRRANSALYHLVRSAPSIEVVRIGDALAPRRAHQAIIEGAELADRWARVA